MLFTIQLSRVEKQADLRKSTSNHRAIFTFLMPLNNIHVTPYAFNFSLYVWLVEHEGILFVEFFPSK